MGKREGGGRGSPEHTYFSPQTQVCKTHDLRYFSVIFSTCQKLTVSQGSLPPYPRVKLIGVGVPNHAEGVGRRLQYLAPVCPHLTALAGVPEKSLFLLGLQVIDQVEHSCVLVLLLISSLQTSPFLPRMLMSSGGRGGILCCWFLGFPKSGFRSLSLRFQTLLWYLCPLLPLPCPSLQSEAGHTAPSSDSSASKLPCLLLPLLSSIQSEFT